MDDSQETLHNAKSLHAPPINIENVQLESGAQGQRQDNVGCCLNQALTPSSDDSHHTNFSDNTSTSSSASGAPRLSSMEGEFKALSPVGSAELRVQQKPRFAMGPRADCDLCRRGVTGHSAHWNF